MERRARLGRNILSTPCLPEVRQPSISFLCRGLICYYLGIYHLARTELDDAFRSFEVVLGAKSTNIVALLGKTRIAYARNHYLQALRLFQQVLQLKQDAQPDPRVGIALCFWSTMDKKAQAKACWERSPEVVGY